MNRVLKRPMFRLGGSAEGITSGLDAPNINASRQGYATAGTVQPPGPMTQEDIKTQVDILKEAYGPAAGKESMAPGSLSSFLTNFSLNLAGQPGGNLAGAIGKAGAPALSKWQEARQLDRLKKRAEHKDTVSDAYRTAASLKEKEWDAYEEQIEALSGGEQSYAKKQAANALKSIYDADIASLDKEIASLQPNDPNRKDKEAQKEALKDKLKKQSIAIYVGADTDEEFQRQIIQDLLKAGEALEDILEYFPNAKSLMGPGFKIPEDAKDGGRIGYNTGGDVMMEEMVEQVDETGDTSVADLTYNELRSRLPNEISNDIVQLLSGSKQALLTFANIRTQQDVDNFNQLYDVDLVLPQGG